MPSGKSGAKRGAKGDRTGRTKRAKRSSDRRASGRGKKARPEAGPPEEPVQAAEPAAATEPAEPTEALSSTGPTDVTEPTPATEAAAPADVTDATGPTDIREQAAPEPSEETDAEAPRGDARRKRDRLSTGVLAAVGIVAGGLAFLLGSAALIVTSGGTEGVRDELGQVREQLTGLSAQVAELERKTGRVAELEKALRESEAALKEAEGILGGAGKLRPTPGIVAALKDLAQLAKLPSITERARHRIEEARTQYEREQKKLVYDYDKEQRQLYTERAKEQARVKKLQAEYARKLLYQQKALEGAALKAVVEIYKEAQKAETRRKWEEALLLYQDVASVRIRSAARYVNISRGKVRSVRAKMEAAAAAERAGALKKAQALREAKTLKARKALKIRRGKVKGKRHHALPDAPPDRGVEVF